MRLMPSCLCATLALLASVPCRAAETPANAPRSYALPCPPSELLRRHDALLALAVQVRNDLLAAPPPEPAGVRAHHTTLFQIAILERDGEAAQRALARVRETQAAPAAKALAGLFTEPYLEARLAPGSDFHAAYRERLDRKLAALPYADAEFTLDIVRGQMATATPDTVVGTARAALDPLVQDGRLPAAAAAALLGLAVQDELVRSAREDVLACLRAVAAAREADARAFEPRLGRPTAALRGPWFGQPKPGRAPARFAPAILDSLNPWCNGIAFSPDGRECWLSIGGATYGRSQILAARCDAGGVWSEFAPPAWVEGFVFACEPHASPDGDTLYFTAKHRGEYRRLWATTRTANGWSAPVLHPAPIEGAGDAYRGCRANDGTWYFGLQVQGMMQIQRVPPGGAAGPRVEPLPAPVNTRTFDGDPCIAPDGRWLVFNSARNASVGRADLFVSFADGHGGWTEPRSLGPPFNSPDDEFGAMLSPDGRQLFFTRYTSAGGHLMVVDAGAIDALRPAATH